MTKTTLDLFLVNDIYLMIEQIIRGGAAMIKNCHACCSNPSNPLVDNYDLNKEEEYIIYSTCMLKIYMVGQ